MTLATLVAAAREEGDENLGNFAQYIDVVGGIAIFSIINLICMYLCRASLDVAFSPKLSWRITNIVFLILLFALCASLFPAAFVVNPPQGFSKINRGLIYEVSLFFLAAGLAACYKIVKRSRRNGRALRTQKAHLRNWLEYDDDEDFQEQLKALAGSATRHELWGVPVYLATAQWSLMKLLWLAEDHGGNLPSIPNPNMATFGDLDRSFLLVLAGLLSALAIAYLCPRIATAINPTGAVLSMCFDCMTARSGHGFRYKLTISRWRSDRHRSGFFASKHLLRSLNGLRTKLPEPEYENVADAYRRVAYLLQRNSIAARGNPPDESFTLACISILALTANEDVVRLGGLTGQFTQKIEHRMEKPKSKLSKSLAVVDGVLQRNSRALTFILGSALVCILVATGQFGKVLDFLIGIVRPN